MSFAKGSLGSAALYYASLGWAVFPLVPRDKVPLLSAAKGGKGLHDATTDAAQITAWWTQYPSANVGIATGAASGLIVVDVDGEAGETALALYGEMPVTVESRTGKGRHLLFQGTEIRNSAGKLGPQLDVRGDGGYIVAAPSVHPNGHAYHWVSGRHPGAVAVAAVPDAIAKRAAGIVGSINPLTGGSDSPRAAVDVVLHGVTEGGRNQALSEYVGRLLALGARELEVLELARGVNATKFTPPLPAHEVEAVVKSIATAHARNHAPRVTGSASAPVVASPMAPVTVSIFDAMLDKAAQPVDAMPTMWNTWNRACRMYGGGIGLARGWHVVAAGGAGAGKSLLALNLTAEAVRNGHSVGWVSLEMSREQLLLRLLGIATGRKLRDMEPGASFDAATFTAAAYSLTQRMEESGGSLWMAERPKRDLVSVERLAREAIDAGCRLIVFDYMQLITVAGAQKLDEAMRQVSGMIQEIAYGHNVTTLALSQFNRATTADKDAPPTIFGLSGSSAIENDADQILLIDHSQRKETPYGKEFSVLLDKNRHGPGVSVAVCLDPLTLRIDERTQSAAVAPKRSYYEREGAA